MKRGLAPTDPQGRRVHYATTLPMQIDEETLSANLDGGVLTIRVRKSQQGGSRRIAIGS
jgi:HSP20 family molecular chaperone IbpA